MADDKQSTPARILIAGGGTAGHIEPALAVADALVDNWDATVWCLGTTRGLETDLVPARGHTLELIDPVPVPRKPGLELVKLPLRLIRAVTQTIRVIKTRRITRVIGFGGYVSAPAYLAACLTRTPFYVHEANARAGLANKLGTWLGGTGLVAYPDSGLKGSFVGMPVRSSLTAAGDDETRARLKEEAADYFGLKENTKTVLVTGGSQGAQRLNKAVAGAVGEITGKGYQVLHAYGKKNDRPTTFPGYVALPFIDRMDLAYAAADLVVCRSGAMTVAEVTASRTPAIYVPLPHGNGEQALNAGAVVDKGAAVIVDDQQMTADCLSRMVADFLGDESKTARMVQAAAGCAAGSAAESIARLVATGTRPENDNGQ